MKETLAPQPSKLGAGSSKLKAYGHRGRRPKEDNDMATTTRTRKPAAKTSNATTTTVKTAEEKPSTRRAVGARKPAANPKTTAKPAAEAEATEAAPSANGTLISERAAKAQATRAESAASDETRVCEGACGKELPTRKFPTTTRNKDGVMGRGNECRTCRDARRAASKETIA